MPRLDEVRALLVPLEADDIRLDVIADDPVTEAQVHVRYQTYLAGFTEYVDWRDDQMDDGIDVLRESDSSSTLAETLQREWSDFFLARGSDAAARLNRLADNVDFHAPALRARSRSIVTEETQFWAQLAAAPLAHTAGELVHRRYELATEQERLGDKWEAIGDQSGDLSEKTARATADLTKLLGEVVEQIVTEQRGLVSKVEKVRFDPQALVKDWKDALVAVLKAAATVIFTATERIKVSTESYLRDLTNLHQQTEGVAVMFVQMREDVRRFLEPRRLQVAKALFESASAAGREAVSKCPTPEQRADALVVIERAIDEVEPIVEEFELAFESFVDEYRDVFIGPVGPATIERLVADEVRERERDALDDLDLEDRLQQLVDASAPTIFVDVEGMSDADEQDIKDVFLAEWRRLAEGLVAARNDHLTNRVVTVSRDFGARVTGRLKDSKGGEA